MLQDELKASHVYMGYFKNMQSSVFCNMILTSISGKLVGKGAEEVAVYNRGRFCEIRDFHCSDPEGYCIQGCNAM
jgi:hypothetical protein